MELVSPTTKKSHLGNGKGWTESEKREEEWMEEEEKEREVTSCGIGSCRPVCMQRCANVGTMTLALCFAGLSTSTLSMYINSQITTLERQFGFSSSVSGVLLSCNDLGYLLTTLLMSYLTRRVHIPRILSLSTFFFGISGLLCTVPFFVTRGDLPPLPSMESSNENQSLLTESKGSTLDRYLCQPELNSSWELNIKGSNSTELPEDACGSARANAPSAISEDGKELAVVIIALGMICQGFGKSPRQPFINTYIDDNVPKAKTALYLGFISCASIFGPVLAFTLGGLFSRMYLTLEPTVMSPMDPRWVGAWWLGFLLFGFMGVLAAIPTLFFPRRLRRQTRLRRLEKERKRAIKGKNYCHDIKDFFKSILRLLRTPIYVSIVLGTCSMLFGTSGMIAFMPKYIETQFMVPAWQANIILGIMSVMAAAGGTLVGGFVTSRFRLTPKQCLKVIVVTSVFVTVLVVVGMFVGCDQPALNMGSTSVLPAGLPIKDDGSDVITGSCQSTCHCDDTSFFPTCGADGTTYFSPCHAGCSESQGMGFSSCACINATLPEEESRPEAVAGFCAPDCGMLYPFAILNFLHGFFSCIIIMPSLIAYMRSVPEVDKPLAVGLSAFLSTLLGWFLGPIVFGWIVDACCALWSSGCDGTGSCILYDIVTFRYGIHTAVLVSRIAGCIFYGIALFLASRKGVHFFSHTDNDVIEATLPPEGEKLVWEKREPGGKAEDDNCLGGERIYKGTEFI